jgi:hypothetical protein
MAARGARAAVKLALSRLLPGAPAATSRCPRGARPYRRVMLVSLKCCFSVLLRWFAKLLRALALILCHALLAAPLHQRWD